ncbi:SAM-dependent methyltransferase [Brevundimonas denitrificans]|uniref:SAM-dependent methyltransferase n=1 Tax=Brevundimonas denitrificans TaxID=1443434 RepID=UPI00223B9A9C|nr:class I SAM-dependent methyltransferase [Brevundimonas denitrificans]
MALDLGAGNATVAIGLARDFGLKVRAVERDPVMAALASRRIAASGQGERVELLVRDSSEVLDHAPLPDLITVLGATDAAAPGLRDPVAVFARLKNAVAPGGRLLWGEPFWKAEPSAPLRQIVEMTNSYQTDAGWRTAAEQAGWRVVHVRHSTDEEWRTYIDTMDAAVRAWAAAHPEAPEAPRLIAARICRRRCSRPKVSASSASVCISLERYRSPRGGSLLERILDALSLAARRLAA